MGAITFAVAEALIFLVSLFFSMFGKGGGEFYIVILNLLLGMDYYRAAGTTLFILVAQGASMLLVYHYKLRLVDWLLASIAGGAAVLAAFVGGYVAGYVSATILRAVFVCLLIASAYLLLRGISLHHQLSFGPRIRREKGSIRYEVAIILVAGSVAIIAFLASMAGISGGSLIVPLLVIFGGVPLRIAIGTNPVLVTLSSTSGFFGHLVKGGFSLSAGVISAIVAITGSQIGARMHAKMSDRTVRMLFGLLMLLAAVTMAIKMLIR
jgi:uncharacterized membrane protein YfcA